MISNICPPSPLYLAIFLLSLHLAIVFSDKHVGIFLRTLVLLEIIFIFEII